MVNQRTLLGTCILLFIGVGSAGLAADNVRIEGEVVDASGAPLAGALIGTVFDFDDGKPTLQGDLESLRADHMGRFAGTLERPSSDSSDFFYLIAFSSDFTQAGLIPCKTDPPGNLRMVLGPAIRVRADVVIQELDRRPAVTRSSWNLQGQRMARTTSSRGKVELPLPPAEYACAVFDENYSLWRHELIVPEPTAALELDLGQISLPASPLVLYKNKIPPEWTVTAARNAPLDKSLLADFRGKWVVVEFFNYR